VKIVKLSPDEAHFLNELMDLMAPTYGGDCEKLRQIVEEHFFELQGYAPDKVQEIAVSIFYKTQSPWL